MPAGLEAHSGLGICGPPQLAGRLRPVKEHLLPRSAAGCTLGSGFDVANVVAIATLAATRSKSFSTKSRAMKQAIQTGGAEDGHLWRSAAEVILT